MTQTPTTELLSVVRAMRDYIDALPSDVVASLPTMPGFDRDWADEVIEAANRETQPVGYIAEVCGNRVGVLRGLPLPDVGSLIYTAPPAPVVNPEFTGATAVPDDYFGALVKKARSAADKAMRKFPQPNYVLNKVAEESGEVIKAVIHYTEGREEWANVEGEIIDNLAMLIRLVVEGDQVIGFTPPDACRAAMLSHVGDATDNVEPVMICDMCGHGADHQGNRTYKCDNGHVFHMRREPVSQDYKLNSPEIPDSWIACTEQTPDADGAYWCWFGKEEPSVIQQRVCIWINRNREWCDSAVTHWMPLPAAPIQGEKQ